MHRSLNKNVEIEKKVKTKNSHVNKNCCADFIIGPDFFHVECADQNKLITVLEEEFAVPPKRRW